MIVETFFISFHFFLKATVVLKNVSGASRQLRVIPLSSPFFKVHTGQHEYMKHGLYSKIEVLFLRLLYSKNQLISVTL